jgi:hypothetical protein
MGAIVLFFMWNNFETQNKVKVIREKIKLGGIMSGISSLIQVIQPHLQVFDNATVRAQNRNADTQHDQDKKEQE